VKEEENYGGIDIMAQAHDRWMAGGISPQLASGCPSPYGEMGDSQEIYTINGIEAPGWW
jgi:hypothetical protein